MSTNIKNAFEASNARDFTSNQLVSEFIWTNSFSELLESTKNQIVLGSRGSGKTALIKMLSHQNLRRLSRKQPADPIELENINEAKKIIEEKELIATYVPLKVEWVNSLNNFENSKERYFIWSLNLATCARLLDTLTSCIEEYIDDDVEATLIQRSICKELSSLWLTDKIVNNADELRKELESLEYQKNLVFNKESMGITLSDEDKSLGLAFHGNLFSTFTIATKTIARSLQIPEYCKWVLCLDEAEFLSKKHHEILNTHMRSANDIFFKVTTMPYRHHTLSTTVSANVNVGHDLEYVYIDKLGTINMNQTQSDKQIQLFATKLFENRLRQFDFKNVVTLESLVGESKLSQDTTELVNEDTLMTLIERHCNEPTIARAKKLKQDNNNKFNNEIARKIRGILLLRDEYHNRVGSSNTSLYSGGAIISRCSDGNPRRIFRLFNHLVNSTSNNSSITPELQGKRIKSFSHSELEVLKFEKGGKNSFELLKTLGAYFKEQTLQVKLGTDLAQSISVNNSISDDVWDAIKSAVDLGLLYPVAKKDSNHKNLFPDKEGDFCLANCLAPHFNLFPRVGRAVSLKTILNGNSSFKQIELF
ncbi:ORC-CDC6 family AAA ATPase [Pseudoalteromonas maricaloris]|uniref:Uncharacterized protein n=1 Tax=Pseudoalteromonas maricaloris TaxID=184924 RepID=A0A8I2H5V6_9GAMM|nr:hypothetical protein [Pseudoalteromonas maricaloris]NLR21779.1 hypothetical protein [Pseudoalteromonas maricaloris]WOX28319.1 hypothetical protein R5H13_17075 [Pseudoalteromonas maricaloris]